MPAVNVNGVRLFYTLTGDAGPPLVLVHGSWADWSDWELVLPALTQHFRVLAYDRRGHSQSQRVPGQGSVDEDAADLAALIEALDLAPAHVAGLSSGGSIALRLATRRPDLLRSVSAQEPPLFGLLAHDPDHGPMMQELMAQIQTVAARLAAGDTEGGARQFVEEIALGPGAWAQLPPEEKQLLLSNASTFLDETRDPELFTIDLAALAEFSRPVLLTHGDQSHPSFAPVVAKLATSLPGAGVRVFAGSGHLPMVTHPAEYVAVISDFVAAADAAALLSA